MQRCGDLNPIPMMWGPQECLPEMWGPQYKYERVRQCGDVGNVVTLSVRIIPSMW